MPYRVRAGAGVGIETVATARTNAARQGEAAADAAEIIVLTQIISLPFGLQKAWRGGRQKEGGGGRTLGNAPALCSCHPRVHSGLSALLSIYLRNLCFAAIRGR